jgi:hypothetical protein
LQHDVDSSSLVYQQFDPLDDGLLEPVLFQQSGTGASDRE